ncbi:hypothetical protein MTO96_033305 [Rhipicephalus appendiculatus]
MRRPTLHTARYGRRLGVGGHQDLRPRPRLDSRASGILRRRALFRPRGVRGVTLVRSYVDAVGHRGRSSDRPQERRLLLWRVLQRAHATMIAADDYDVAVFISTMTLTSWRIRGSDCEPIRAEY